MLDHAVITVHSGRGGDGRVSFLRLKYVPKGGPDGGDGGHGGSVYVVGDANLNTLRQFHAKRRYAAEIGEMGGKSNKHGKNGEDLEIPVPVGTTLYLMQYDPEKPVEFGLRARPKNALKIVTVNEVGQRVRVCRGGRGGRGNHAFKSSVNQAPQEFEPGGLGEEYVAYLELKVLADAGFVGFPNAGKSSLLASLTRARPEIANYPFTTLTPNLGVMGDKRSGRSAVLADIPGLIEGASEGKGLGFHFLRHLERCRVLVITLGIDLHGQEGNGVNLPEVVAELAQTRRQLELELSQYEDRFPDAFFQNKGRLLVVNKIDLLPKEDLSLLKRLLDEAGMTNAILVSAATGTGMQVLRQAILDAIILEQEAATA